MGRAGKDDPSSRKGGCRRGDADAWRSVQGGGAWILWILVSVLAGCGLGFALVDSRVFSLRGIDVVTVPGELTPEEVRGLSGVRIGTNLLRLATARISRLLEADPRIRHATVRKRFPDRLEIRVLERRPAMLVPLRGGLYYMDAEGIVFRRVRPGDALDFPVLTGLKGGARRALGIRGGRWIQQVVSLLRTVEGAAGVGRVSEIHIDPSRGMVLFLEGFSPPVVMGWTDFRARLERLRKVLPDLLTMPGKIESVDLRFSGQVVARQRAGGREPEQEGDENRFRAGSASPYHPT